MYSQEMQDAFYKKLDRNYADFVSAWLEMEPTMLIQEAEEIAATKLVYDELKGASYHTEHIEPLLKFENPLEVARDAWVASLGFSREPEMVCILGNIADGRTIGGGYELDEAYAKPEQDGQGMTMT